MATMARTRTAGALAACLMMGAGGAALAAPVAFETVAVSSEPLQGTGGRPLTSFSAPVLNDAGAVAFRGVTRNDRGGNDGFIYVSDAQGGYVAAREGETAEGRNDQFDLPYGLLSLNDAGQVAVTARFSAGDDGPGGFGVLRTGRDGTVLLAGPGGPVAGAEGVTFNPSIRPSILGDGRVVSAGQTSGRLDGRNFVSNALMLTDDEGVTVLAAEGLAAPGTDGLRFGGLTDQSLGVSEGGRIAFGTPLEDARGRPAGSVLYGGTPDDLQVLMESGEVLPGSDGRGIFTFRDVAVNDTGQVAFEGQLQDNRVGLFLTDGELTTSLVYSGDEAPDTNGGVFSTGFDRLNLNDEGEVVFRATFDIDGDRTAGLFGIGADGSLFTILKVGDMLEVADGDMRRVRTLDIAMGALNDAGMLAFTASFDGGSGIFLADVFGGDVVADAVPLPPAAALFALPALGLLSRRRRGDTRPAA